MKLISLNTWSGRAGNEKLLEFFRKNKDIDIFCLQEVWEGGHDHAELWRRDGEAPIDSNSISNLLKVLPNHNVFFKPHYMDWYGLALCIKKDLKIEEEGDIFVFKERENSFDEDGAKNHARNLQYAKIKTESGLRTICNFHGLWNGVNKEDTPERIDQADNLIKFLKDLKEPHLLCGDFNLMPQNKSLKMIEDFGMKNLIKEYGVTTTRSGHYTKPEKFADYTLVSDGIKVNEFRVLKDEVSDHLAMYLDFE